MRIRSKLSYLKTVDLLVILDKGNIPVENYSVSEIANGTYLYYGCPNQDEIKVQEFFNLAIGMGPEQRQGLLALQNLHP